MVPGDPNDPNNPAYMSPEAIKSRQTMGQYLTKRATEPFAPHWSGILAAGITGLHGGLERSGAESALANNQKLTSDALKRAGEAKDNTTMSKVLMGSGIPGMGEKGLDVITSQREKAADRAASFANQKSLFQMNKQFELDMLAKRHPLELEQQEKLAAMRARIEREGKAAELKQRMDALGLSDGVGNPSVSGQPQTSVDPASAATQDPYVELISPNKTREQEIAERKKRAGQAILMDDAKGAAKILNKEEDLKENQSKDAFFSERMIRTEVDLRRIMPIDEKGRSTGYDPTPSWKKAAPDVNVLTSKKGQEYQRASKEWIAGMLRKDTGAAVTDTEFALYFPTYFPQAGDSDQVVLDKQRARMAVAKGLRNSSGPAFGQMFPRFDADMRRHLATQDPEKYGSNPQAGATGTPAADAGLPAKANFNAMPPERQKAAALRLKAALAGPNAEAEKAQFKEAFGEAELARVLRVIGAANFQPAGGQ